MRYAVAIEKAYGNFSAYVPALLVALALPALAEEIASQHSAADVEKCRKFESVRVDQSEPFAAWVCSGVAGYVVTVTDDDLRTTVSVGTSIRRAKNEPAAGQSFGPFNSAHERIEWRGKKGAKPFAIVQRWTIADQQNLDKDSRPLGVDLFIVTRLPPGPVCHVAYVDVNANADAEALARRAADESARGFRCGSDEILVIGNRGRAIELSRP
jgi:hypothetical protein